MTQLVNLFGFLSVLLRAVTLTSQSLTLGGIVFVLYVARPVGAACDSGGDVIRRSGRRLIAGSALALALTEIIALLVNSAVLVATAEIPLTDVVGANFFLAGAAAIAAALGIALLSRATSGRAALRLLPLSGVILITSAMTSHAASRIEGRVPLAVVTALHQGAVAAWIGGLPYLLMALARCPEGHVAQMVSSRFSKMAMVSVAVLGAAGIAMAAVYIDSLDAIYGTAYGIMLTSKVVLFVGLLLLGAMNFYLVRRWRADPATPIIRLRRFAEAEFGIGLTIILAAASLTSQPPAVDLTIDRVSATEIADRMTPHWPRLTSSRLEELSPSTLQVLKNAVAASRSSAPQSSVPGAEPTHPNTAADIAWSEYNHHWAGILVLVIGLLALAERTGHARWARHWPLLFLALAAFLFLRSDPENWPYGPDGFFESFADPEVAQHRAFVVLIVAFGLFEWAVRRGRIASARAAQVFPLICAVGGALLLTHSHSLGNVKEELLIELTHVPLALLGVTAGWARWLELRLPPSDRRIPAWIWPVCFLLVGLLLLLYRES